MFAFVSRWLLLGMFGCGPKLVSTQTETKTSPLPQTEEKFDMVEQNLIRKSWSGRVFAPQYIEPLDEAAQVTKLVIRTDEELASFVARIPKKRIQKKQPAPDSDDPFVNGLQIDFETSMLLVSLRSGDMYSQSPIIRVFESDEKIVAHYEMPFDEKNMMMASAGGVGTYHAVQVPMSSLEVKFKLK
mgnify:CR=1 FL=1